MKVPSGERHLLSKSTFMMGRQCPKRLWLYKKKPELADELSAGHEMVFERGTNVGLLARDLFPGGKDATPEDFFQYPKAIKQTYDWIKAGEIVIYEAAFQYDQVMAALDILVQTNGKWVAYEVKSSTEVKDQFLADAALQYYVIKNAGLDLADFCIIHINPEYSRVGDIEISKLFTIISVKKQILELQKELPGQISNFKEILKKKSEPVTDIGPHCSDPYECDFQGHCWSHIPDVSVFDLSRLRGDKKFDLYYKGFIKFQDIPDGFTLTTAQQLQVKAHLEDYTHIEPLKIKSWLRQLKYPLYFMDFETFMPAVPLYDHSTPYQQIPFQYSLHVQDKPGAEIRHFEFLGNPESDPRPGFIEQLIRDAGKKGTILVYNKGFETARLNELSQNFPEYSGLIKNMIVRIVDLMEPFQQKWYYTPAMNGSYSIKSVLPALVPELSYDDLEIGEGGTAMAAFEGLLKITDHAEREKVRKALLEFCKLDTWAMVRLLEKLKTAI